ncbi:MAG: HpaII family restriction endonuclease [Paludibacteraceae bacterium]
MALKGNKGEWSELYVLFKLLGEQKIHAGDGMLNKLEVYYPILKILRDELLRHMEYSYDKDIVIVTENGNEVSQVNISEFMTQSEHLFKVMKDGGNGNGAFELPSLNDFLKKIHCDKIKAKSLDKSDIHIIIHDYHTGMQPNLGFSIKSDAGGSPTLLNSSAATSFLYKVCGNTNIMDNDMVESINGIEGNRKIQDRVNAIYNKNYLLKFDSIESDVFYNNLRMIDSLLPEIMAWLIIDCYKNRNMNIKCAVERITAINPFNFNLSEGHDFYKYKMKCLMIASALGMLPAKPWNGQYDATGGYIVVKEDGDIICFHIYDRNQLEDYLFNNTKFETPSSSRHEFSRIENINGELFFKLNLQIRFN